MSILNKLSGRAQKLGGSTLREILKLAERPGIISLAGGLPNPSLFPVQAVAQACDRLFALEGEACLQYGSTDGYGPLREWIAAHHSRPGMSYGVSNVLITTGSQQGLDLLSKLLLDTGDAVLVENPSYLGALQAMALMEPRFIPIPKNSARQLELEQLGEAVLSSAKCAYLLPNFQNPSGRQMGGDERNAILEACARHGLVIIEDNPYDALNFEGEALAGLHESLPEQVAYLGSFSKILAPGLRVGYVLAPAEIISRLALIKQAGDLHTPNLNQRLIFQLMSTGFLERQVPQTRAVYQAQRNTMLGAIEQHFPADVQYEPPKGGMFIWVELDSAIDTERLLASAVERGVAFVPGAPFYVNPVQRNCMRLSFSTVPEKQITQGIQVLGEVLSSAYSGAAAHSVVL